MQSAPIMGYSESHEIVTNFDELGFSLSKVLCAMLNESPEHCKPRRGCGYTQSGRFLADIINQPRCLVAGRDLKLFSEQGQRSLSGAIKWVKSYLGAVPSSLDELENVLAHDNQNQDFKNWLKQIAALKNLPQKMVLEESQLITRIIISILNPSAEPTSAVNLPAYDDKLAIGTCPEAERFFMEFAGGYVRRQGLMNVLVDEFENPVLVEKINIGDTHSCLSLVPVRFRGVLLPAGSLFGVHYTALPVDTRPCAIHNGAWIPISACEGFRFLRLTTLAISPENRLRAYSSHVKRQLEGNPFFDPLNTKLSDLQGIAIRQRPI